MQPTQRRPGPPQCVLCLSCANARRGQEGAIDGCGAQAHWDHRMFECDSYVRVFTNAGIERRRGLRRAS